MGGHSKTKQSDQRQNPKNRLIERPGIASTFDPLGVTVGSAQTEEKLLMLYYNACSSSHSLEQKGKQNRKNRRELWNAFLNSIKHMVILLVYQMRTWRAVIRLTESFVCCKTTKARYSKCMWIVEYSKNEVIRGVCKFPVFHFLFVCCVHTFWTSGLADLAKEKPLKLIILWSSLYRDFVEYVFDIEVSFWGTVIQKGYSLLSLYVKDMYCIVQNR